MSKKKKKSRKKHPPLVLTPEQENKLASLLSKYKDSDPNILVEEISSPQFAAAFLEKLPVENNLSQLLVAVFEKFPQKEVRKALRKLLFKLKTKGFEVPPLEKEDRSEPIIKPVMQESPRAMLGSYDAAGTRGVMVAIPRFPRGFDVAMGVISEQQGILEFFHGAYSKRGLKEVENTLLQSDDMTMVETSLAHAATALEKAYASGEEAAGQGARAYAEFRPALLSKTDLLELPPIYEFVPQAQIDTQTLTHDSLDELFAHPLMKFFIINSEKLSDLVEEISKLQDSPIYLTEEQKLERRRELEQKWIQENLGAQERGAIKYRLEEMAYILWRKEERKLAWIAVTAASIIEEENNIALDYLFSRTLSLALGELQGTDQDAEENPDSLIISP